MPTHIDPNRYLDPIAYADDPVDESQRAWAQAYAELDAAKANEEDSNAGVVLDIQPLPKKESKPGKAAAQGTPA